MKCTDVVLLEISYLDAERYAEGLTHLCSVWYSAKKHDKHLLQKHLHSYNAIKGLIAKLNKIIREYVSDSDPVQSSFDPELAREVEAENKALGEWNTTESG
jgi:hypothetical protein